MAKPELIARQSRLPSGWLGKIVARVMSLETALVNRIAADKVAVQAGEAVLEIGCGHGRTLARLGATPDTFLAGIDPSDVMVRLARRRLRRWIAAGRADVALASSDKIPFADARFDASLAVHVIYFWRDPLADLAEIRRVLRPGGRLLLVYRPSDEDTLASLPASVYTLRSIDQVEALLRDAGFESIVSDEHSHGGARFAFSEARRPGSA